MSSPERRFVRNPEESTPEVTFEVDTEKIELIRMNMVNIRNTEKPKPHMAYATAWVDGLPIIAPAYYQSYFWNKNQKRNPDHWYLYAPVPVHHYTSPIPEDDGLTNEEKEVILERMGVPSAARSDFKTAMSSFDERYSQFLTTFRENEAMKTKYEQSIKEALMLREDTIEIE